ncbi:MAG: MlaD family protein [Solirubrobacteraceae bacterium]
MKRVLAVASVLIAAAALAVFATGSSNDGGSYKVRAIFMNAFSVIHGEDVKVAGVKVGKIESLDVTPDHKAAVVLDITEPGFNDFRKDAECTIRPQSLIGEKFVECTPTQPRPAGAQVPPPLQKIKRGPGKGQYLLPVTQTSRPVDLDLLNNTLRLPYRERLAIILNELGTGLAGRGGDLRIAVRNADPALKETDKVLAILAAQNRTLQDLASNGDTILAPLARDRGQVADFVVKANTVAQATAERSGALEQDIQKLPGFLAQLKPTMTRLGSLSDEMTPVLTDLGAQAPAINRLVRQLGPFSQAATPALTSLGDASIPGRKALVASKPIIGDLRQLTTSALPVSENLSALLNSLKDTGGIERVMDYVFYQVSAINGFDSFGHYLRAGLILNTCSQYSITSSSDCLAKFTDSSAGGARAASLTSAKATWNDPRRDTSLRRLDALLHGIALPGLSRPKAHAAKRPASPASTSHRAAAPPSSQPSAQPAPAPGATTQPAAPAPRSPSQPSPSAQQGLLDYLLGGGG